MQTSTILFIILAVIVALGLVLFQYYYKSKKIGKRIVGLSFLRFIALLGIFILLINPKLTKNEYTVEKANLVVLTDISSSLEASKSEVASILEKLKTNRTIKEKFKTSTYSFGANLKVFDSLSFKDKNTNIAKALVQTKTTYANTNTAVLLLTDGNQTIGEDYAFLGTQLKYAVFPIAVGDTTQYEDVRISSVNTNKFAFLKNKYPIEINVAYTGNQNINTWVAITVNGKNVYRENIKLSNTNSVKIINTQIEANTVGIKNIKVFVNSIPNERNTINNEKNLAVEVIDEKTNIAIISDLIHPDIGALKNAIESNEQRSVQIKKSNVNLNDLNDIDVFILYQPTTSFSAIYNYLQQKKASIFSITGENINMNFLNGIQKTFRINGSYPVQETFPVLNSSFTKFDISEFSIDEYPPLNSGAGIIGFEQGEILLQMKVMGKVFDAPLLFALDNENGKELVLFGENIWKWRMQSYRNNKNFENFDDFIGKLMLYLASNKTKTRLNIDYQTIYTGNNDTKIKASYFDEAFVFDADASLDLKLKSSDNGKTSEIPMLLKSNFYEADLSFLEPGKYAFSVGVQNENRSKSGSFTILDYDVEQQFLATDYKKLGQLAADTGGTLHFPNQVGELLTDIIEDQQYIPTQKSTKNVVSLIDFRILLALIVAALSAEWLIRKYNGLI